ncbi:MAG: Serine/threonine-protein kinase PknB [Lentisphaerae bacterium ADurb.Bin242]|nr:MAG: Serine/threonine-protein kinase PknB [Lentisphaerae bacterium ADurb.Bin242]
MTKSGKNPEIDAQGVSEEFHTEMTMVPGAPPQDSGPHTEMTITPPSEPSKDSPDTAEKEKQVLENQESPKGSNTEMTMAGPSAPKDSEPHTEMTMTPSAEPKDSRPSEKKTAPTVHDSYMLKDGEVLGKYIIEGRLGKGGMGEIYLAKHDTLGVLRAIKVLPKDIAAKNSQFLTRFIREAKTACEIRHSNVVNVMDVETDDARGLSYIVMEYVDGGTVRNLLKAAKRLTEEQALVIIEAVCEALAAAEEYGIVHRDIKPDNIMLTRRGDVKLADLGIAKSVDEEDVCLTRTNVMMGTPAYLSPEQARDAKHVDIRADIYSLGATFYEMLTGQVPYPGSSTYDILSKLFSDPVPDPRALNPEITPGTAKLIMKMLDKEANNRYQNMAELLSALGKISPRRPVTESQKLVRNAMEGALGTDAVSSPSSLSTFREAPHFLRKKRKRLGLAAGAVAVAVLGIAGFFLFRGSPPRPEDRPAAVQAAGKTLPPKETAAQPFTEGFPFKLTTTPGAKYELIQDGKTVWEGIVREGFSNLRLPQGSYRLKLSLDGYLSAEMTVESPQKESLERLLLPVEYNFALTTTPGTLVEIKKGQSAWKEYGLVGTSGKIVLSGLVRAVYTLRLTCPDYVEREELLTIPQNKSGNYPLSRVLYEFDLSVTPGTSLTVTGGDKTFFNEKVKDRSLRLRLPGGEYKAVARLSGYAAREILFAVPKDKDGDIAQDKNNFDLRLSANVNKVRLELSREDGKMTPVTEYLTGIRSFKDLPGGNYIITASCDGYENYREVFTLARDQSKVITLLKAEKMDGSTGGITISSVKSNSGELEKYILRNGAEVKLKNTDAAWKPVRFPYTMKGLSPGEYTVLMRVREKGIRGQESEPVNVRAGTVSDCVMTIVTF